MVMSNPLFQITPLSNTRGNCVTSRQKYGIGLMLHSDAPFENECKGFTTDVTVLSPGDTVVGGLENVPQTARVMALSKTLESNQ